MEETKVDYCDCRNLLLWPVPVAKKQRKGNVIRDSICYFSSGNLINADGDEVHTRIGGGAPAVMRYLLEHGLLDGDCITVTGKTVANNAASFPPLAEGQVWMACILVFLILTKLLIAMFMVYFLSITLVTNKVLRPNKIGRQTLLSTGRGIKSVVVFANSIFDAMGIRRWRALLTPWAFVGEGQLRPARPINRSLQRRSGVSPPTKSMVNVAGPMPTLSSCRRIRALGTRQSRPRFDDLLPWRQSFCDDFWGFGY
ncbi:Dihydroxy-acid dehydratase [Morella rubra]|uniref:Dihydroxy-acid dehydratase n=1 Tax=Morella rubra TaxID=262757 RepID=A0A6A1VSD2_9ROSI|nr:Dihydroxy-acid dehydratase [Morella rubra]KAB1215873.1 Dihydroxy-acid dehydratase [Morella rubra]